MTGKRKPRPVTALTPHVKSFLAFKQAENSSTRTISEYDSLLYRLARFLPTAEIHDLNGNYGADLLIGFINAQWAEADSATVRKYTSMLKTFTAWLSMRDIIEADPGPKLPKPKRRKGAPKPMPEQTYARLLEAASTDSDRLALLLLGRCGLRRAELAQIRFKDFDLLSSTVSFIGKGGKRAEQALLEPVRLQVERTLQSREPEPDDHLLYPSTTSNLVHNKGTKYGKPKRPMSETAQDNWWASILYAADVPPAWTMHKLRHTAGTHFYRATRDPQATQRFMRHESIQTTFEYYVLPNQDDYAEALHTAGVTVSYTRRPSNIDFPSSAGDA